MSRDGMGFEMEVSCKNNAVLYPAREKDWPLLGLDREVEKRRGNLLACSVLLFGPLSRKHGTHQAELPVCCRGMAARVECLDCRLTFLLFFL